jgi:Fungal chitosanase of glycosyl hydrolase group 75
VPFQPPSASSAALQGLDFGPAVPVAADFKAAFNAADAHPNNRDPSRCKALLRFPDGTVFWSSKMAIDADGPAAGPDRLRGTELDPADGQNETTYRFPNGGPPLSSEVVPYLVVPLGEFRGATGLNLGDIAVVVFGDKKAGAIVGDLGPRNKIGEGSIRLHELLHPPAPDPCIRRDANGFCQRIRDASIAEDVLFFVFPGSALSEGIDQSNAESRIAAEADRLFSALKAR